jgi:hypothetical protein
MNRIWKILFSGLLSICLVMVPSIHDRAFAQDALSRYLVVPDYVGQKITINILSSKAPRYSILTPNCNPNSVAYKHERLYVACNQDSGNGDRIEVYDFVKNANLKPRIISVPPIKTIASPEFNSIIAINFDPEDNLWVSSYNNNQIVRFSQASLNSPKPTPDKKLINSPDKPVGITFGADGSLWVAGQYQGGIVLNIPKTELDKPGTIINGIAAIDATPSFCISNAAPGCQQQAGLFDNPEGIAILNNDIWVSNNGGDHPAASLIRIRPTQGQTDRFGNGVATPFSCPGGLDAGTEGLWINDQSFTLSDTTCGATDSASGVGTILAYRPSELTNPTKLKLNPWSLNNVSSRPGFGGIDVFSSSIPFN